MKSTMPILVMKMLENRTKLLRTCGIAAVTSLLTLSSVVSFGEESDLKLSQSETTKKLNTSEARIQKLKARLEKKSSDHTARLELAEIYEKKGDAAAILGLLKPVTDTLPRRGLLLLARAFAKQADTLNEVRTLELCLAKNAQDYVVQTALGDSYLRAKRFEEAVASYREARQINARYRPTYDGLLAALEKLGERYEARVLLNDMMKYFGTQPSFLTDLCRLYALDNFLEKSIEVCRSAIERNPKNPDNYIYLGLSLKDQENPAKAAEVLSDAAKRFPASELAQTSAGELEIERKNFVAAHKLFQQAVAIAPQSGKALAGLANTAFELQKTGEALEAYKKACAADRRYVKDFRLALAKLRTRRDINWEQKYDDAIAQCM